jgi:hypothetical protein
VLGHANDLMEERVAMDLATARGWRMLAARGEAMPRMTRRVSIALLCVVPSFFGLACKGKSAVSGRWLFISDEGKPGACHVFEKKKLEVYKSEDCKGAKDDMASGRFQLKDKTKLAIQRGKEKTARLAHIIKMDKAQFRVRGTLNGTFYRIGDKGGAATLKALRDKGVVQLRPLPGDLGCQYLARAMGTVKALKKEDTIPILRVKDRQLKFFSEKGASSLVEKVTYGLNVDDLEWVYVKLTKSAFEPPGPAGRLEKALGAPKHSFSTGKGEKRQTVLMWRAYCEQLKGQRNVDVDITLFSTPGKQKAYYYVSENIISELWEGLIKMANDPANQPDDDDDDKDKKDGKKASKPAAKTKEPPKKVAKKRLLPSQNQKQRRQRRQSPKRPRQAKPRLRQRRQAAQRRRQARQSPNRVMPFRPPRACPQPTTSRARLEPSADNTRCSRLGVATSGRERLLRSELRHAAGVWTAQAVARPSAHRARATP